jgi:hypothetical protein
LPDSAVKPSFWQVAPINNHPATTQEDVEQILEKAYIRALESE